ncbi:glutathione S-transferase family protein [Acidisphaera sp. S103]|uniref:glutathione S-transferase family protein n=1 Tax=Acidisphaera sp. S103 TaxID=1747223 RepID=UPI00131BF332|nr:glutathione S-transferase [Acidisphaera sp. S103]
MPQSPLVLHGTALSGHAHRVELFLLMLKLPYRFAESPAAVRQSDAFRRLNPLGQIPVLQDGELVLADSNAILVYLAKKYAPDSPWLPEDPIGASHVQRWLSIAAGEAKFGPGLARLIAKGAVNGSAAEAAGMASTLLGFMDGHLSTRVFLAADHPTIADLACYSYVAVAPDGGITLEPFPAVRAWLRRVEALPGFRGMPAWPG